MGVNNQQESLVQKCLQNPYDLGPMADLVTARGAKKPPGVISDAIDMPDTVGLFLLFDCPFLATTRNILRVSASLQ